MAKVWIDVDQLYPTYIVGDFDGNGVEVEQETLDRWKRVDDEWYTMQTVYNQWQAAG
jgi:catechol-2,3-dioxygenase